MTEIDYLEYYDLEKYLFDKVSARFRKEKTLSAEDFFCIVIWKANRAKSKIATRLLNDGPNGRYGNLDSAVHALMQDISNATDAKKRLEVLIDHWHFRLPMASAILTVLFPDEFTIYDARVCEILKDFEDAQNKTVFDKLWERYSQFLERVKREVPQQADLRDKDRYLWGKSFKQQLEKDVREQFTHASDPSEFKT